MIVNVNRDAFAGAILALLGAFIALYSYVNYPLGQISRMGPGMFPFMLGCGLSLIALIVLVKSFLQPKEPIEINLRASLFVLIGLAVFAILIDPFGVAPALFVLLVISSYAVPGRNLLHTIVFSAIVTAAVVFIFVVLMGLHLQLFGWPA